MNSVTPIDQLKLLYTLLTHQIELKSQSDEPPATINNTGIAPLPYYLELFDCAPISYFVLDIASRIIQTNFCGADLLEIERGKLLGLTFISRVANEYQSLFIHFLEAAFSSTDKQTCEISLISDNTFSANSTKWIRIEAQANLMKKTCLAAILDISKEKQIEYELHQKALLSNNKNQYIKQLITKHKTELAWVKAASAHSNKCMLLANMSYETRTVMQTIVGFAYLLRNTTKAPEQLRFLEKIDAAAQHLLSVINNILDISKIEMGYLELMQDNFCIADILYPVRDELTPLATAKNITLKITHDTVTHPLQGDLTRLRQIVFNYLNNAITFTNQGNIWLKVKLQEENTAGFMLKFEVKYSGKGTNEKAIFSLFESFIQADYSSVVGHNTTELGLVINHYLIKIMGGDFGVENLPNQGNFFWFTVKLMRTQMISQANQLY
ncbi:MAG: ATP-binding protein [Methylococcales bacterium]